MSLPLMPGSEPVVPIQAMPEPQRETPRRLPTTPNGALGGCDCDACERLRMQYAEQMRTMTLPVYDSSIALDQSLARPQSSWFTAPESDVIQGRYTLDRRANASMAGGERWLRPSTGELFNDAGGQQRVNAVTLQPDGTWQTRSGMIWEALVPDRTPNAPNAGRIRGRYDFSQARQPEDMLQGRVRWREPGTFWVYDEGGIRQWTYTRELPGGVLEDDRNCRWVPTEV